MQYLLGTFLSSSKPALAYHLALGASVLLFTTSTGPAIATHANVPIVLSALGTYGVTWFGILWYFKGPIWEAGEKMSPFAKDWYGTVASGMVVPSCGTMEAEKITKRSSTDGRKTEVRLERIETEDTE